MTEHSLPHGSSKGHEQVASFHMLAGSLQLDKVRVLANAGGKAAPGAPLLSPEGSSKLFIFRSSKKAAEDTSVLGWACRHDFSCGGKG